MQPTTLYKGYIFRKNTSARVIRGRLCLSDFPIIRHTEPTEREGCRLVISDTVEMLALHSRVNRVPVQVTFRTMLFLDTFKSSSANSLIYSSQLCNLYPPTMHCITTNCAVYNSQLCNLLQPNVQFITANYAIYYNQPCNVLHSTAQFITANCVICTAGTLIKIWLTKTIIRFR